MKKLLALLLIAALLAPCALAEEIDVKSMTDEELKALYISVKEELMDRKLWDSAILPAGIYQAGKGLQEGAYECIAKKKGTLYIYKDYESFLDGRCNSWVDVDEGEEFILTLYGGITYRVTCNATVRPFTGLVW